MCFYFQILDVLLDDSVRDNQHISDETSVSFTDDIHLEEMTNTEILDTIELDEEEFVGKYHFGLI